MCQKDMTKSGDSQGALCQVHGAGTSQVVQCPKSEKAIGYSCLNCERWAGNNPFASIDDVWAEYCENQGLDAEGRPIAQSENQGETDSNSIVRNSSGVEAPAAPKEDVPHKEEPASQSQSKDFLPWDSRILQCGGLLQKIADFTFDTAVRTERIFALAGAISVVATLVGQRLQTESALTTNFYTVIVGPSSCGKNAPLLIAKRILSGIGAISAFGGKDLSSDTALLRTLERFESRRCLFGLDEVGKFLQSTKGASNPRFGISKILTDLFTDTTDYAKPYAKKEDRILIPWHSLSVLGATVGSELWPHVSKEDFKSGFLARALFFETTKGPHGRDLLAKRLPIPQDVLAGCKNLWSIDAGDRFAEAKNEEGKIETYDTPPDPFVIKWSDEALAFHVAQDRAIEARQNVADDGHNEAESAILGRCAEIAAKLALVRYASDCAWQSHDDIVKGQISLEQIQWAWLVMSQSIQRTIFSVDQNITDSKIEATIKKFIEDVKACQKWHKLSLAEGAVEKVYGASRRDLLRNRHYLVKDVECIAETLKEAEAIIVRQSGSKVIYCLKDTLP